MSTKNAKKAVAKRKKQPAYKAVPQTTTVAAAIGDAFGTLEELKNECEEARNNLEEKFSSTNKYQMYSDAADTLDGVSEPDVAEHLQDILVVYSLFVPTRKNRGTSRAQRLSNAVSMLDAAKSAIEESVYKDDDDLAGALESTIGEVENVEFPGMYG